MCLGHVVNRLPVPVGANSFALSGDLRCPRELPVPANARRVTKRWSPRVAKQALTRRLSPGLQKRLKQVRQQNADFQNECRLTAAMHSIGRAPDDRHALKR